MSSKTGFKYVVSKAQYTLSHHISEKLVSDARIIQLFSSPGRLNFEVVLHTAALDIWYFSLLPSYENEESATSLAWLRHAVRGNQTGMELQPM